MSRRIDALSTTNKASKVFVHWFRHADLRIHDNPALTQSIANAKKASSSSEASGILPIFCFDPRYFGSNAKSEFNSLKCGPRRAQFLLESVSDLRSNLEKKGSGLLVVANVKSEDVFESIQKCIGDVNTGGGMDIHVTCQEEVASEETRIDKAIKSLNGKHSKLTLETVWGSTLYDPEDLPFNDGLYGIPDTFTPFRNKVEKNCKIGAPLPEPSKTSLTLPSSTTTDPIIQALLNYTTNNQSPLSYMPSLSDLGYTKEDLDAFEETNEFEEDGTKKGVMTFVGGETAALARVKDYIWDKDLLKVYFDTRNGMLGADYSTKFSPWLAHGCLSPRYVAQQCSEYEQKRVANKSTYWVIFELLWRDFFKFFAKKHGNSIFFLDGTLGRAAHGTHPNSRKWGLDKRHLQAWKDGMTGYPLVDANMRELKASGFMSNRGRQNVCSFLAIDMNTDWRYGADHFEQELLDYDIYSNWGNWCSGAGMTGGRLNRFNIVKQSKDYDCHGEYVKYWCPELKDLPVPLVHEPWKMTPEEQENFAVKIGRDYPKPIVQPSAYVPQNRDGGRRGNGGRGGKGGQGRGKNNKGGSYGRGQRKEMKSLKQGEYKFK